MQFYEHQLAYNTLRQSDTEIWQKLTICHYAVYFLKVTFIRPWITEIQTWRYFDREIIATALNFSWDFFLK
jgi:hypothetical protein